MIFITVGTHEQPFDRLLKYIDNMIESKVITEKVICQKGFTNYESKNFSAKKLISYEEMQENIKSARIVITHGGPASFIDALKYGKIPIVVPRKKEFNEHVNNHQVEFSKEVEKRMKNILVAENEEELLECVVNYEEKIRNLNKDTSSNNSKFNGELLKQIEKLF